MMSHLELLDSRDGLRVVDLEHLLNRRYQGLASTFEQLQRVVHATWVEELELSGDEHEVPSETATPKHFHDSLCFYCIPTHQTEA